MLDLAPEQPKALYRIGQANTQLGRYAEAQRYLTRASASPHADASVKAAVAKELARLGERRERHARQRKRACERMVSGASVGDAPKGSVARALAGQPRELLAAAIVAMAIAAIVGGVTLVRSRMLAG